MIKVLFVCLGYICRSPTAEAVFCYMLEKNKLEEKTLVESAATSNYEIGSPPYQGARNILKANNIACNKKFARQLTVDDMKNFDYIIGMDEDNIKDIVTLGDTYKSKVYLLSHFVRDSHWKHVPDPYYSGNFQETFDLVSEGCSSLLKFIRLEHNIWHIFIKCNI